MGKGLFITFEGADGCGKSTQLKLFAEYLEKQGIPFVMTEEPGGTALGKQIKKFLLDPKFGKISAKTELLLFAADRAQHVREVILPNLDEGKCVISSRFSDATTVYQGMARGLDLKLIEELARVATNGLKPDITFLLDVEPETGLARTQKTDKQTSKIGEMDKIESEGIEFQKKVREGYLRLAENEKERFCVIPSGLEIEEVHQKIIEYFNQKNM